MRNQVFQDEIKEKKEEEGKDIGDLHRWPIDNFLAAESSSSLQFAICRTWFLGQFWNNGPLLRTERDGKQLPLEAGHDQWKSRWLMPWLPQNDTSRYNRDGDALIFAGKQLEPRERTLSRIPTFRKCPHFTLSSVFLFVDLLWDAYWLMASPFSSWWLAMFGITATLGGGVLVRVQVFYVHILHVTEYFNRVLQPVCQFAHSQQFPDNCSHPHLVILQGESFQYLLFGYSHSFTLS